VRSGGTTRRAAKIVNCDISRARRAIMALPTFSSLWFGKWFPGEHFSSNSVGNRAIVTEFSIFLPDRPQAPWRSRRRMLRTVDGSHFPPRAVAIPRAFRAAAIWRRDFAPAA
jgi:hypothetical protein